MHKYSFQDLRVFALLGVSAFFCPLFADEVKLKNGDRISGTITRLDDKELAMRSEFLGEIRVQRSGVTSIETTDPVNIALKDGQSLVGLMKTVEDRVEISTESAGVITAKQSDLVLFRNKADQATYLAEIERLRNPRLVDLWTGSVDLAYSQARGNAITSTITSGAKVTRTTSRDAINAYFFSLYASNRTSGVAILSANSIRGGIKYDVNISSKWYAFGSTDLEYDQFQNLDLRFVPAGGFGYHFLKNKNTIWDWYGGASLNREFFNTGLNRTSGEVLLGNDLAHKFGGMFTLSEHLVFYNNVTNSGNYRLNGDLSLAIALKRWLSFQVAGSDRYLSNPLPGRKTNDLLLTTGIRLIFAKQ